MPSHNLSYTQDQLKAIVKSDKTIALLGLLANQPNQSNCPSMEQLADFIDNQLPKTQRQEIKAHLKTCSECRFHYREVLAYHRTWYWKTVSHAIWVRVDNFLKVVNSVSISIINTLTRPPALAIALSMVTVTVISLMVMNFQTAPPALDPLSQQVAASYQALIRQPLGTATPTFSGQSALGFMDAEMSSRQQAFVTGLQMMGKQLQQLQTGKAHPKIDQQWIVEYELGRWLNLLSAAAAKAVDAQFWKDQRQLADLFKQRLRAKSEDQGETWLADALTELEQLTVLLSQLEVQGNQVNQVQLGYQLTAKLPVITLKLSR